MLGCWSRGLSLITRRPRLFLLGAIPPVITSVIFTGLLVALITQLDPAVEWLTPFADGWARGLATAHSRARRQRAGRGCRAADGDLVHHTDPRPRIAAVRQVVRVGRATVR